MNKIFKVIWSKSKQCYVVVSEMAKNTTGKKKIVVAGILASLMMQPLATMDVDAMHRLVSQIKKVLFLLMVILLAMQVLLKKMRLLSDKTQMHLVEVVFL